MPDQPANLNMKSNSRPNPSQLFVPDTHASILVVGDIILDRYVYGDTSRISPEAPVPVVHVKHTEDRPGGAGNVALNVCKLGVQCTLMGITGNDSTAESIREMLSTQAVNCRFATQAGYTTVTKMRVLSQHQQLIRVDYEVPPEEANIEALHQLFKELINHSDLVILSDYAKGSLNNISSLIDMARNDGKPVMVDPKGDNFDRYKNATLLTPNLKEFEIVVGVCKNQETLQERAINLCKSLALEALLITQGDKGMTLVEKDKTPIHYGTEALEVFDVTGAGDTVIATLAAALASNYNLREATHFANKAAGIVVGKLGASTVSVNELNHAIVATHLDNSNIVTEAQLKLLVENIRSEGKSIVMTNGCFDILHAGHIYFLQQARKLGDCLIVAVNDDNSVKRLKGNDRPVNKIEHRLSVLSSLPMIDWLVSFSEDTPERLICEIKPDFLVKGGDYEAGDIAGGDCVRKNNGEVIIIDLFEDCSSTNIINSINNN